MSRPDRSGPDADDGGGKAMSEMKTQAGHASGPRPPCYHGGAAVAGQRPRPDPPAAEAPLMPRRRLARAFRP